MGSACPFIFGVNLSVCSTNWSGYAAVGDQESVSAVHGSWVVPGASCPTTGETFAAFWVGIDGYNSSTVEQVGTDSDCVDGTPVYYAWYEFYPNSSVTIDAVNVSVGDRITAGVVFDNSTRDFAAYIKSSGGGVGSVSQAVPGAMRTSAEWVVEAPKFCVSTGCSSTTLTGFGTVEFGSPGQDNATIGGRTGPMGSFPDVAITLMTHCSSGSNICTGPVLAEPALFGPDRSGFQVGRGGTFVSAACLPPDPAVGSRTVCQAKVEGEYVAYGVVTWSTSGVGAFSRRSCRLLNGSCAVAYTPTRVGGASSSGFIVMTASYAGDGYNLPSFGATDLGVAQRASKTLVVCVSAPRSEGVPRTIRCTAIVTGYKPSGTVDWSETTGTAQVSLSSGSCDLVRGRCTIVVTSSTAGTVTLVASYCGDQNNGGSWGESSLILH